MFTASPIFSTLTGGYDSNVVILDHASEKVNCCFPLSFSILCTGGGTCVGEGHSAPVKAAKWLKTGIIDDCRTIYYIRFIHICWCVYVSHEDCEEMKWLFVSGSQDQNVHIWRYNRQEEEEEEEDATVSLLHCCKGHARSVEALAVNPDRTKVSVIII